MDFKNIGDISDEEGDKYIYRVMPIDRFCDMVINKKITFVKPMLWDDPFEAMLLNSTKENSDDIFLSERNRYYAQCWTYSEIEAGFIWKIYAANKNGIRIKVKIENLINILKSITSGVNEVYVGNISYKDDDEIIEILTNVYKIINYKNIKEKAIIKKLAETLFLKRKNFRNEEEFRLIFRCNNSSLSKTTSHLIFMNKLIEEIIVDPRIDSNEFVSIKDMLIKLGFDSINIKQSTLYKIPGFKLVN